MSIICRHIAALLSALLVFGPALEAQISVSATSPDQSIHELHLRVVEGGGTEYKTGSLSDKSVVVAVTDQDDSPVPSVAVLFRLPDEGATGAFTDGTRVIIAYSDMQGLAAVRNIQWGSTPGPVVLRITATKGTAHAGILVPEMLTAGGRSKHAKTAVANPPPVTQPVQPKPMAAIQEPATQPAPLQSAAVSPVETAPRPAELPSVSVVTDSKESVHSGHKKWIWIALIGAGAAAGAFAAAGRSHSSPSSSSTPSLSIGSPSVSIGRP
jgi:hypothetical protein